MNVVWTDAALTQLQAVHDFIVRESPTYALRTVDRITRRVAMIALTPFSAPNVPEFDRSDIREVFAKPYRIIYRVEGNAVEILAVIHAARDLRQADFEPL